MMMMMMMTKWDIISCFSCSWSCDWQKSERCLSLRLKQTVPLWILVWSNKSLLLLLLSRWVCHSTLQSHPCLPGYGRAWHLHWWLLGFQWATRFLLATSCNNIIAVEYFVIRIQNMDLPCLMLFKRLSFENHVGMFAVGDPIRSNQTHNLQQLTVYFITLDIWHLVLVDVVQIRCFFASTVRASCTKDAQASSAWLAGRIKKLFWLSFWAMVFKIVSSNSTPSCSAPLEGILYCNVLYSAGSVHVFMRFVRVLPLARCKRLVQSSLQPQRPGTFMHIQCYV